MFFGIDWIIVGAETGNRKDKIIPEREWIERILYNARAEGIPIFLKDNLHYPKVVREFPKDGKHREIGQDEGK